MSRWHRPICAYPVASTQLRAVSGDTVRNRDGIRNRAASSGGGQALPPPCDEKDSRVDTSIAAGPPHSGRPTLRFDGSPAAPTCALIRSQDRWRSAIDVGCHTLMRVTLENSRSIATRICAFATCSGRDNPAPELLRTGHWRDPQPSLGSTEAAAVPFEPGSCAATRPSLASNARGSPIP